MKKALTSTKEDYIRAIFYLQNTLGREAKSVEIAKLLTLGRSTVTERLQELSGDGYVLHGKYGGVSLTEVGRKIAKRLTFKHRIIEVFLHSMLHRPIETVHNEAHKLEHAFSDESIRELYNILHKPKLDPHGKPIIYL